MSVYRLLFGDIVKRLAWRFPAILALMALVGVGEGAAIALLLPLLSRVGPGSGNSEGFVTTFIENRLTAIGATDTVHILCLVVLVAAVQTTLFIFLNWWTSRVARRYQSMRQSELFRAVIRARWSFFAGRKVGDLTSVIVTESERLGTAFAAGLTIISTMVVTIIYVGLSLLIAWPVTLMLGCFAIASGLGMMRLYRRSYAAGRRLAPLNAELQSMVSEQLGGVKIVKATASEDRAAARLDPLIQKIEKIYALVSFMPHMARGILEFLAVVGFAIMFVLGHRMGIALGNVLIVLALYARLFPRITTLQAQLHYLNGIVHAIEVVNRLQLAAEAEAERQDITSENIEFNLPAKMTVRNLDVKFDGRKVLENINMAMSIPGMFCIVGGSGAGKSTLAHAVLGLLQPSAGSIELGQYDISSVPLGAWRHAIGYVPQETILFHASVRENLTLANPSASEAEIEKAVQRAHARDFIEALPESYGTIIGDQGVKLSGGQRKRLGIARALLTNPKLLILDEAMSAFDAESESDLLQTLEELRGEMGVLMIAHRLASVRTADCICVFESGRIVEMGTWNELMARGTRLYTLAEAQSLGHDQSVGALQKRTASVGA